MKIFQSFPPGSILVALCLFFACVKNAAAAEAVFNVKDFGALGNGEADDTSAIKKAIESAIEKGKEGHATVILPTGKYSIATSQGKSQMMEFNNACNITIQGEKDVTFLVRKPTFGLMKFVDGKNLTFKSFDIDYSPLPITQMKVLAVKGSAEGLFNFEVEVQEGFPAIDETNAAKAPGEDHSWVMAFTADGIVNPKAPYVMWKGCTAIGKNRWKISLADCQGSPSAIKEGDILTTGGRMIDKDIFHFDRVDNITLEGINDYTGPGLFVETLECSNLKASHCRIAPPEKSHRLIGTCAGGFRCLYGRKGPTIENCYFAGSGDDDIDIGAFGTYFFGFAAENEMVVTENPWTDRGEFHPAWRVGDTVILYKWDYVLALKAKITSLSYEKRGGFAATRVKFDPAEKDFFCLDNFVKDNPLQDKPALAGNFNAAGLPVHARTSPLVLAYNIDDCQNNFLVQNNTFTNHRARGVLAQSRHGIIRDNTFSYLDCGVLFLGGWYFKEGPLTQNILVENNKFTRMGLEVSAGAICMVLHSNKPSPSMDFSDIQIRNNSFSKCLKPAVYVNNAARVEVTDNSIECDASASVDSQIVVGKTTKDIKVSGNKIKK